MFRRTTLFSSFCSRRFAQQQHEKRNPCNLEQTALETKQRGFALEKTRSDYYHRSKTSTNRLLSNRDSASRLNLIVSNRHTTATVNHRSGTIVAEASTRSRALARHFYKTSDVAAATNVGRLIAHRLKEFDLTRVWWERTRGKNNAKFPTARTRSAIRHRTDPTFGDNFHFVKARGRRGRRSLAEDDKVILSSIASPANQFMGSLKMFGI